jgi:hypothetical protein
MVKVLSLGYEGSESTKLRLIGAIDYEKDKTKSVDVRVTDAAGHEYVETVTITITDINDSRPSILNKLLVSSMILKVASVSLATRV